MEKEKISDNQKSMEQNMATIGNFDGLHIAHQMLIRSLYLNTHKFGTGKSYVISFEPHPLKLLGKETPKLLIDPQTKREFVEKLFKCDEYVELEFTQELADMSPEEFVRKIIIERFQLDVVFVGFNFSFGKGGEGTPELLQKLCAKEGIKVVICPPVTNNHGTISSTMVREQLKAGDIDAANKTLRYWYTLRGEIVKGNQFGREMGFPTANIVIPEDRAVPQNGVYAVRAVLDGKTYNGIANLGTKPTVSDDGQLLLETHLFNFLDKDLYGRELLVFLYQFMRPEIKFESVDQLRRTVKENMMAARSMLAHIPENKHLPIEN